MKREALRWIGQGSPLYMVLMAVALGCGCAQEVEAPPVDTGAVYVAAGDEFGGGVIGRVETSTNEQVGYYENGVCAFRRPTANGLTEGVSRGWYPSGQLKYEEQYAGGLRSGRATQYDESGRVVRDDVWLGGVLVSMERESGAGNP